jgi:serine/threonine protein kinase
MPLAANSRLGNYEIVAPLGAGGMGEVYRGHDTRLGRDVAIKVLPDDLASSPDRLARFEREARMVARLNHPNIVTLYSIEEASGTRFITMELVEGRNLADVLTPGGMPIDQVVDVMTAVADALGAAHGKGIVHRDLKPGNVMMTPDGRVKVLDFGLAKLAHAEPDRHRTGSSTIAAPLSTAGEVLGTVPYMAPEQIFGEDVDVRTDIFSFGVLAFELVAGRRPFVGKTTWETSAAIMRDDPPSLRSLRADTPGDLERAIYRCLAKQPNERFQSALELAGELRAIGRNLEGGAALAPSSTSANVASIAVLPFANRSADADDEYFSDGAIQVSPA